MAKWNAFPYDGSAYRYGHDALKTHWARLHAGDVEPWAGASKDEAVLAAWALFHAGEFEQAVAAGLAAKGAGLAVANKAQIVYATYLETNEQNKQALFLEAARRAEAQAAAEPGNANTTATALHQMAVALGRYAQGISVAQAMSMGLGMKIKSALEKAIRLAPAHADAHLALGAFHAGVIDKVGSLLGITQGASKEAGLNMFKAALRLNPGSAIAMVEYANGMVMLDGDRKLREATRLYEEAAACVPMDATERLDVEAAKAELAD